MQFRPSLPGLPDVKLEVGGVSLAALVGVDPPVHLTMGITSPLRALGSTLRATLARNLIKITMLGGSRVVSRPRPQEPPQGETGWARGGRSAPPSSAAATTTMARPASSAPRTMSRATRGPLRDEEHERAPLAGRPAGAIDLGLKKPDGGSASGSDRC